MKTLLSDTTLPQDETVKAAWNLLAASPSDAGTKDYALQLAELACGTGAPDSDLAAALLLEGAGVTDDAAQSFPQRTRDMLDVFRARGDKGYQNLRDPANAALPLAKEIRRTTVASGIIAVEKYLQALREDREITRDDDAIYASDAEHDAYDTLHQARAMAAPLLGTTGAPKLEQRFIAAYNELADAAGVTPLAPPAAAAPKTAPPRRPGPGLG